MGKVLVGYYYDKMLFISNRDRQGFIVELADGSEIKGLRINNLPNISDDIKMENDSIYLSNNERLLFKGGALRHEAGNTLFSQAYVYGIGKGDHPIPNCNLKLHDRQLGKNACILERDPLFSAYVATTAEYDLLKLKISESNNMEGTERLKKSFFESCTGSLSEESEYLNILCNSLNEGSTLYREPIGFKYFCGILGSSLVFNVGNRLYVEKVPKQEYEFISEVKEIPLDSFEFIDDFLELSETLGMKVTETSLVYLTGEGLKKINL